MISGKQVFPKQETKHQLEGRSLTGNQDYSRQNFCSPEGRKKATAKSPDCEKMCPPPPGLTKTGTEIQTTKENWITRRRRKPITRSFARGYNRKILTRQTQIQAELTRVELRTAITRCGSNVAPCSPVQGHVFGNQFESRL